MLNICAVELALFGSVQEDEMWNDLDDSKLMENYGLDSAIYVHAKQRAMESVDKLLETRKNINGSKEFKCPESLVEHYKPVTCYIRQWIAEHALILVPFTALLLGCTLLLLRIRRRHYLSVRAEQLYNQVCDILEEKALTSKGVNVEQEAWVVASWLRDHLLSPRERKHPLLWKMVEDLVQQDSRLDRFPKMVKGESKVVWEWQVEGSLSSSGKRKKHEESKLKSSEGTNVSSNQQRRPLQYGEPWNFIYCFATLLYVANYWTCLLPYSVHLIFCWICLSRLVQAHWYLCQQRFLAELNAFPN
ncbi:unnamed protein product [Ilex paraguariensis]|uniref:Man1/Src1-like C-terminal domain-containing protein n=1 Tax=Ilex paraguariensis TaxID=185542 RepID=A0ABC8TT56_9AQUA